MINICDLKAIDHMTYEELKTACEDVIRIHNAYARGIFSYKEYAEALGFTEKAKMLDELALISAEIRNSIDEEIARKSKSLSYFLKVAAEEKAAVDAKEFFAAFGVSMD